MNKTPYISVVQSTDKRSYNITNKSGESLYEWINTISVHRIGEDQYISSIDKKVLDIICTKLGIDTGKITDTTGRSRQLGGMTGYALLMPGLKWNKGSIEAIMRRITTYSDEVNRILIEPTQKPKVLELAE